MPGPDIPVPHWTVYVAQDLRQAIDEMERHAKELQKPIDDTHNWAIGDLIAEERPEPSDDDVHRKKRSPTHFHVFADLRTPVMKQTHPTMTRKERQDFLRAQWRDMKLSEKVPYANEFKRRADLFYAANPDKKPKATNEKKPVSKHKLPESKAVVKSTVKPPNSHRVERCEKHKLEFFEDDLPARKKPKSMHRPGTTLQTIPEEATVRPVVRLTNKAVVGSIVVKAEPKGDAQGSSKPGDGQGSKALPIVLGDDDGDDDGHLPPVVPTLRESTRHDERAAAQLKAKGIARHQSSVVSVKSKPPGHTLQSHGFKRTISMPKPQKPILPSFRTCDYCRSLGLTGALVHHMEKGCRIKFRDEMRAHQSKVLQTPEQRTVLAPMTVTKQPDSVQTVVKSNVTSDTGAIGCSKNKDADKNDHKHDNQNVDQTTKTTSEQAAAKRDKTQSYANMPARSFINASKLLTSLIRGL